MTFRVYRTSKRDSEYIAEADTWMDGKPCEEAYSALVNDSIFGEVRGWLIDMDESEILNFVRKYGKCVIHPDQDGLHPTIEIYDTWRE